MPLVLQFLEHSKSELAFDGIRYMVLFFCLAIVMIIMMLIPVVLSFSMVVNFISMRNYKKKIDTGICFQENNNKSKYLESICKKYLK